MNFFELNQTVEKGLEETVKLGTFVSMPNFKLVSKFEKVFEVRKKDI